ncbi:uncharacterized protein LOC141708569 [Apium graveolens]|uniref:uncharacterized protein LOC141708569 n=1 Tax=Apium graveolens TaxID=4045 RepID=UPI003D7A173D
MMKHLPGSDVCNAPDVVSRVFKLKLEQLMDLIKKKNYFGKCIGIMHVKEFQKRGLPHCHMLIWLHPYDKPKNTDQIDSLVSAEIPDKDRDPVGYAAVKNYMIHGPCGKILHILRVCKKGSVCVIFLREKKGTTSKSVNGTAGKSLDEVQHYLDGRYVCASEAAWRIFGFDIHSRWPSVDRLPVHLPGQKYVNFKMGECLQKVWDHASMKRTKLEAWFIANRDLPRARYFTYAEFPAHFTWLPIQLLSHRQDLPCLRDIMSALDPARSTKPFGGITVVFGGDFRQILLIIPKESRAEVVGAALNATKLWNDCQVGDGKLDNSIRGDNRSSVLFPVPEEYVVRCQDKPIENLYDIAYLDFIQNMSSHSYLRSRAILTPINAVVDDVNKVILDKIPGMTHTYLSQDSLEDANVEENEFDESFPVEYLNSLNMPCLPKHELKIKVGSIVMLMRNLNQILGLCNGTRMVVTGCKKNNIECQILTGAHVGRKHLISRIDMVPTDTKWPFEFKRTQFPLQLCFAMTVNKSQCQSLDTVGLYLPKSIFCHGQMYVVISQVTSPRGLYILIDSDTGESTNITENVVYEEILYNLPTLGD